MQIPASLRSDFIHIASERPIHIVGIRSCAYEIYLERGEQPGRELDDWLQAERELERLALAHPRWTLWQ